MRGNVVEPIKGAYQFVKPTFKGGRSDIGKTATNQVHVRTIGHILSYLQCVGTWLVKCMISDSIVIGTWVTLSAKSDAAQKVRQSKLLCLPVKFRRWALFENVPRELQIQCAYG